MVSFFENLNYMNARDNCMQIYNKKYIKIIAYKIKDQGRDNANT